MQLLVSAEFNKNVASSASSKPNDDYYGKKMYFIAFFFLQSFDSRIYTYQSDIAMALSWALSICISAWEPITADQIIISTDAQCLSGHYHVNVFPLFSMLPTYCFLFYLSLYTTHGQPQNRHIQQSNHTKLTTMHFVFAQAAHTQVKVTCVGRTCLAI